MAKIRNLADDVAGMKLISELGRSPLVDAITKQARIFGTMDRIANPLGTFGAPEGMARVGLADQIADIHRAYGASFLLAKQHEEHTKLAESMTAYTKLFEHSAKLTEMCSLHKMLFDSGAFSQFKSMQEHAKTLCGPTKLLREYDTIAPLHESIARSHGLDHASRWGAHLSATTAPASALLAMGMFDRPTGVLSAFDNIGGSLAWLRPGLRDEPVFSAAALVTRSEPNTLPLPRRLDVRCDVRCSICDEPMLVQATDFRWESDDEVVIDLGVVPICATCTRRAQGDPAYWSEQLAHLTRPKFEVIDGGGEGDGEPAGIGILRAVPLPVDEDE